MVAAQSPADTTVAVVLSRDPDIGQACARELRTNLPDTCAVVLVDVARQVTDIQGVETDGIEVRRIAAGSPSDIDHAVASVIDDLGPVEILVTVPSQTFPSLGPLGADGVIEGDLLAVERVVRRVVPTMVERGWGRIVLLTEATSLPDRTGWDDGRGIAMWGLIGLARTVGREVAAHGVCVNVVRTTAVDRPALVEARERSAELALQLDELTAKTPTRRLADADDVAATVGFLASRDAAYITGIVLPVDGGRSMGLGV